ncbi:hypothetical protein PR002_g17818 [Phytophthora rubi]|uniref:DDE-1 domain-containing protein n=1 Tax=Phytophthora rubi TaxID=129364 RepID=A0A6A3K8C7_9STRA|nr:hypothetical protein PR002_g17818 [Phytophthora rubi]
MYEQGRKMRLTKQLQLDLCAMHTRGGGTWGLATLEEWAREQFFLEKAPGKSSVKKILDKESSLKHIAVDFRSRKKLPRTSMVVLASCLTPSPFRFLGGLDSPTTAGSSTFFAGMDVRHRRGHEEIGSVDLPPARKAALELRKVSSNDVFYMDEAAFFYNASPTSSICLVSGPAHKKKKGRMPIVVATNSSGTEKTRYSSWTSPKSPKAVEFFYCFWIMTLFT